VGFTAALLWPGSAAFTSVASGVGSSVSFSVTTMSVSMSLPLEIGAISPSSSSAICSVGGLSTACLSYVLLSVDIY